SADIGCVQFVLIHKVRIIADKVVHVDGLAVNQELIIIAIQQTLEQLHPCTAFAKSLNGHRWAEIDQYEVIAAILEYRSEGTVCRVGAVVLLVYDGLLKLTIKKRDGPYIQIKAIHFCLLLDVDDFIIDIIVIDFPQFTDSF